MQNKIAFMFLFFLSCANFALAQEPQWELFFPDLSGPIAVDPNDSDIIYIASGLAGMRKSTDGGQTWNLYKEGWGMARPADILINPDNTQEILVGGAPFVGVHKSTDGGKTWILADNGLRFDHHGFRVHQLAFDSQRGIYYLADEGGGAFCGIYRSSDGVNWQLASPLAFCPLSLVLDESNGDLYVGAAPGVWKSTDGGDTWAKKSTGLPAPTPATPIVWHITKVNNSQTLYCTLWDYGIYKTLDGGDNWFSVNDSVTSQLDFRGGLIVAEADTNTIFAGASGTVVDTVITGGIYRSSNGGDSWEQYNIGLPDTSLDFSTQFIFLDNKTNQLYGSILSKFPFSQGEENIFVLQKAVITEVLEPTHAALARQMELRSFPNPFNTQTTLVYTVHTKGQLTLQIFNIVGNEVVRLIDKKVGPGEYRIHWDGTNQAGRIVPSGIYLARVQLGREAATIKLLVQK